MVWIAAGLVQSYHIYQKGLHMLPLSTTIKDARKWVRALLKSGEFDHCPCCAQGIKLYPNTIVSSMVAQLRQLDREGPTLSRNLVYISSGGRYALMVHWDLIAQLEDRRWIITPLGRDFLHRRVTVPKKAYVYNQVCRRMSKERVWVFDCMERFDYNELMGITSECETQTTN